jgi:hypothetical protein
LKPRLCWNGPAEVLFLFARPPTEPPGRPPRRFIVPCDLFGWNPILAGQLRKSSAFRSLLACALNDYWLLLIFVVESDGSSPRHSGLRRAGTAVNGRKNRSWLFQLVNPLRFLSSSSGVAHEHWMLSIASAWPSRTSFIVHRSQIASFFKS